MNDWAVDTVKFKGGLKPTFDYIKSLGMKPGLWISLARIDANSEVVKDKPQWIIRDRNGDISDLHTSSSNNRTACMGTDWYDYIRDVTLHFVNDYGLSYLKLDLAIVTSAYVYDTEHTGCYATDHPYHRDHEESYDVIYSRAMQLFDELHEKAPNLFIDCTFETAGKIHLMDYGIAKHADGNWLSNVGGWAQSANLRVRNLAWGRSPALPATSLVIGNLTMDSENHILALKSLAGTLPIMLGDPRKLSSEERKEFRRWTDWLKELEKQHGFMSFRQDLPGFGEPATGFWDGFARINVDTQSGGIIGVFRENAAELSRTVTVHDLNPDAKYDILCGPDRKKVATLTGKELEEKGFCVQLEKRRDGKLYEITRVDN
ncbi:MAG: alpha-galactosidase [Bacteroidaceae bacterium]|nr:alpha-galactosidase [Bacteroidaceae bacterium]